MSESEHVELWTTRALHRRLIVAEASAETGSRVGGRPPAPLAASPPRCPVSGGPMEYVLTLAGDLLGNAVAAGSALSVLVCRDLACRMKGHTLASPSPILLPITGDDPRAAEASELDSPFEPRSLAAEPPAPDGEITEHSKLGGRPFFIQPWGAEEAARARKAGSEFLFQWYENIYPRTMKRGPYPFLYGALFVFTRIDPTSGLPRLESPSAFWQNT